MILYHGSAVEVKKPIHGVGATDNDYGQGFYMTRSANLGREWAVKENTDGYLNKYYLDTKGLNVLNLNDDTYTVLHWLTILITNRDVDSTSDIMDEAKEYLMQKFSLDTSPYDCITGYRADDEYFSYVPEFLSNNLTYEKLCKSMHLGDWGMQYVLMSPKAFERISFLESEPVNNKIWYPKKKNRESKAATAFERIRQQQKIKPSQGLYILDIIREGMDANDPRLHM